MKNIIKMFVAIILFMTLPGCSGDSTQDNSAADFNNIKLEKMTAFQNAEIGILKSDEVKILASKSDILSLAKEDLKDTGLNLEPYDYKIENINDVKYIRVYSNDNYVSTAELILNENGVYKVGKTVCTSKACASGGGCIPSGNYCTGCTPPSAPGVSGDCVRTTTGD